MTHVRTSLVDLLPLDLLGLVVGRLVLVLAGLVVVIRRRRRRAVFARVVVGLCFASIAIDRSIDYLTFYRLEIS